MAIDAELRNSKSPPTTISGNQDIIFEHELDGVPDSIRVEIITYTATAGQPPLILPVSSDATTATWRWVNADPSSEVTVVLYAERNHTIQGNFVERGAVVQSGGSGTPIGGGGGGSVPDATTAVKGILRLATALDVSTGTDNTKAVTPLRLADSNTAVLAAAATAAGTLANTAAAAAVVDAEAYADVADAATLVTAETYADGAAAAAAAAAVAAIPAASTAVDGLIQLATAGEVTAGTDNTTAVTPLRLAGALVTTLATAASYADGAAAAAAAAAVGAIPAATESTSGIVQLSTNAEALAGTDDTTAMTPLKAAAVAAATLSSAETYADGAGAAAAAAAVSAIPDSSESTRGLIRLASVAETNAGVNDAKAVTPLKLAGVTTATLASAASYADGAAAAAAAAAVAAIPAASESVSGLIQLATAAEVTAGTDDTAAVTPLKLIGRAASTAQTGLVELATAVETQAGTDTTRATTPAGLDGAHSLARTGSVAVNFGTTLNGVATADVTGQIGIQSTSDVQCWIQGTDSTADHNAYEHAIAPILVSATNIIDGVGFTVMATGINTTFKGRWSVRWRWYN